MDDFHAVGITETHAAGGIRIGGGQKFHRSGGVVTQGPLHDVKMVCAPISHLAGTVFAVFAPVRKESGIDAPRAQD